MPWNSNKPNHPCLFHGWQYSHFKQHCIVTARLLIWIALPTLIWFTQPIIALVTADLRVLGSLLNLAFTKGVCWHQTFATNMDCARKHCWHRHGWSVIWSNDVALLDFANDVALLVESYLKLLVAALETMAWETASLGLEVNWQKTKARALCSREDEPLTITVLGQEFAVREEFLYLCSLILSETQSFSDILHHNAITCSAMQNLDIQIWRSRISISTKLKLCNTCIVSYFLYGCECWAVSKRGVLKINGICISCQESNGTTMCGMMMWDRQPSSHIFRLLSKHGISPCSATIAQMPDDPTLKRFSSKLYGSILMIFVRNIRKTIEQSLFASVFSCKFACYHDVIVS